MFVLYVMSVVERFCCVFFSVFTHAQAQCLKDRRFELLPERKVFVS